MIIACENLIEIKVDDDVNKFCLAEGEEFLDLDSDGEPCCCKKCFLK